MKLVVQNDVAGAERRRDDPLEPILHAENVIRPIFLMGIFSEERLLMADGVLNSGIQLIRDVLSPRDLWGVFDTWLPLV
jgi:hypothetical protein